MLPDNQEGRLRCYKNALCNWKYRGYVRFTQRVEEFILKELPDFDPQQIARELHEHVEDGGTIDEQKERRSEYVSFEFHYDLRVKIGERQIYFETVLLCEDADDPDDPEILVVSVHDV